MARAWSELIAEGQQLKVMEERVEAEAGNVRWLWGDLALEVAPMGTSHARTGVSDRLRKFADQLDVSFESLDQYRKVANAWPEGMRSPSQPWVVHQMIMGREDREELIGSPVDVRTGERTDQWTYRAMQRYLGRKVSPHYVAPPTTIEDKAELARELLSEPAVADAALEAPGDALVNVRDALHKRTEALFNRVVPSLPLKPLDDRWVSWATRLNSIFMEGAKLAAESEHVSLGGGAQMALFLYTRLTEKKIDAELRNLLDEEGVR